MIEEPVGPARNWMLYNGILAAVKVQTADGTVPVDAITVLNGRLGNTARAIEAGARCRLGRAKTGR